MAFFNKSISNIGKPMKVNIDSNKVNKEALRKEYFRFLKINANQSFNNRCLTTSEANTF